MRKSKGFVPALAQLGLSDQELRRLKKSLS
jgi:hypothetical protein